VSIKRTKGIQWLKSPYTGHETLREVIQIDKKKASPSSEVEASAHVGESRHAKRKKGRVRRTGAEERMSSWSVFGSQERALSIA